ncbi:MAG: sigma-70 family RNA polymerase sigma factor [Gemmatimonadaceae bacterium]
MTADADAEDVALAAAGDVHAFERLYYRHAGRVRSLARRFVGHGDVDDATQDVFLRAWHKLALFRGDAAFGTWLHRLAVNLLLRRAEVAARADLRNDEMTNELPAPAGVSLDLSLDVDAVLARLEPALREVVVLHDMEGYSHEEIATLLGITASGSKMRLHRARTALRANARER